MQGKQRKPQQSHDPYEHVLKKTKTKQCTADSLDLLLFIFLIHL